MTRPGLTIEELSQRTGKSRRQLEQALMEDRRRGLVTHDADGRWTMTAKGERLFGPILRAVVKP